MFIPADYSTKPVYFANEPIVRGARPSINVARRVALELKEQGYIENACGQYVTELTRSELYEKIEEIERG